MSDYMCEIRKSVSPQEERKEAPNFKQKLNEISTHMNDILIRFENHMNREIQLLKADFLKQQSIVDEA